MIIDLPRFIETEKPSWTELETFLQRLENDPNIRLDLAQSRRFHYLYERAAADLARLSAFAAEPRTRDYLESIVGRAYGEIHEIRQAQHRFKLGAWIRIVFPQVFRRHATAFGLSVAITLAGMLFGGAATLLDPEAKEVLMPFAHLQIDPRERVAMEEKSDKDRMEGRKAGFSAMLMTHNTQVSVLTMALGMTWAVGTIIMLFYNGVILGAVAVDFIRAGQTKFLIGWLLPHGSFEIPAILIAGQAGLILGHALIGTGGRRPLTARLRAISGDLLTLILGVALLLVWAGFVESFFSQYHEPVIPYAGKILFGLAELTFLTLFLWKSGSGTNSIPKRPHGNVSEQRPST